MSLYTFNHLSGNPSSSNTPAKNPDAPEPDSSQTMSQFYKWLNQNEASIQDVQGSVQGGYGGNNLPPIDSISGNQQPCYQNNPYMQVYPQSAQFNRSELQQFASYQGTYNNNQGYPKPPSNLIHVQVVFKFNNQEVKEDLSIPKNDSSGQDYFQELSSLCLKHFPCLARDSFVFQLSENGHTARICSHDDVLRVIRLHEDQAQLKLPLLVVLKEVHRNMLQKRDQQLYRERVKMLSTNDPLPMSEDNTQCSAPQEGTSGCDPYEAAPPQPFQNQAYPSLSSNKEKELLERIASLEARLCRMEQKWEWKPCRNESHFDVQKEYRVRLKPSGGYIVMEQVCSTELFFNVSTFNPFYGCISASDKTKWHYRLKGNCTQRVSEQCWAIHSIEERG